MSTMKLQDVKGLVAEVVTEAHASVMDARGMAQKTPSVATLNATSRAIETFGAMTRIVMDHDLTA